MPQMYLPPDRFSRNCPHISDFFETDCDMMGVVNCKYYDSTDLKNHLKTQSSKKLSFLHQNVVSLNLHFDDLKAALRDLDRDLDIIGITETRLKESTIPAALKIKNYTAIHTQCEGECGGALLYISDNLPYSPRPALDR